MYGETALVRPLHKSAQEYEHTYVPVLYVHHRRTFISKKTTKDSRNRVRPPHDNS
ncbi:hypothetical protein KIN20_019112 [Parelaphostrongylus tenuis]|uniref:Uncharacterized protein n=1 Tax=Parelaphostrongylus tenuis TaxID=148309 RepID=A0AAD5MDT9_PARTN|nr:hypothetical protein KIN20_000552 [Parelaphostrongylus tenuis]KAJ1360192.1 hypothetical protein KIN20_019112 [Parelaphostrongylus tenuis]